MLAQGVFEGAFHEVAGNVHEGVVVEGVDPHAGAAGVVVVMQANLLDRVGDGGPGQLFGREAGAAAAGVAGDGCPGDGFALLVDLDGEGGPAEVAGEGADQPVVVRFFEADGVVVDFGEGAEGHGGDADNANLGQPAAQLAGEAEGQPRLIVDGGDDGPRARHLGDLRDHFGDAAHFGQGKDEVGRGQFGGQILFGVVEDGRQHARRLPRPDAPAGRGVGLQVVDVAPAVVAGYQDEYLQRCGHETPPLADPI